MDHQGDHHDTHWRPFPNKPSPLPKAPSGAGRKGAAFDIAAAEPICQLPGVACRCAPLIPHPARARLIKAYARKWINGCTLHYYFFNRNSDGIDGNWAGSAAQKAIVRRAFCHWKDIGIGLEFQEVSNREEAEIRIGFADTEATWSFIGKDAIDVAIDPDERTMNVSADLTTIAGWNTILTEIGRALGFMPSQQEGTSPMDWDDIIKNAQHFYPPLKSQVELELRPLESIPLRVSPGEQYDLRIRPELSRDYTLQVFGQADAVMVLFEDVGGLALFEEMDRELEFVAGDDNSGENRNACIVVRLCRDREYVLRVRVHYAYKNCATILFW